MILDVNERRNRKAELGFPDVIAEGKKYGLNEEQLVNLTRYLNNKRLLRVISLEQFRQNAGAWLAALTGIVAEVLAMDAHVSIWMNKKLEKPRNWILSKLNAVIPTKIDDIAIKAMTTAQTFTDDTLLPLREKIFSNLSSKMHDQYQYHANATALGLTLKEQKELQKERLKESEAQGKAALKELRRRQGQASLMNGIYKDEKGYYHDVSEYKGDEFIAKINERHLAKVNEKIRKRKEKENEGKDEEIRQENEREDVP